MMCEETAASMERSAGFVTALQASLIDRFSFLSAHVEEKVSIIGLCCLRRCFGLSLLNIALLIISVFFPCFY